MTRRQIAAYITVCLLWGSTWGAIRIAVQQVPPMRVAAVRFLLAGFLLYLFARARRQVFPSGRSMKATILFGVVMIGLQYALVFCAEQYLSSGLTAILYASSPLVVAAISPYVLKKPVPRAAMTAMLVGLGGLLVLLRSIVVTSSQQMVPALVMLLGMLISSVCSVYASRELQGISAMASLAWQFLIGGSLLAVMSFVMERNVPSSWSTSALGALIFLVFLSSITAFSLYYWLLQNVEPYRVITVQFLIPVLSVVEGTLLLHERIPLPELLGGVVVLSAVVLVLRVPSDDDGYLTITPGNHDTAR